MEHFSEGDDAPAEDVAAGPAGANFSGPDAPDKKQHSSLMRRLVHCANRPLATKSEMQRGWWTIRLKAREAMMKVVRWLTAVAAIASILSVQASDRALGAQGDPEVILYRFSGVFDNGSGPGVGVATIFHCTNFSGVTENVRFVVRDAVGGVVANFAASIAHLRTLTFATHPVVLYLNATLNTGQINLAGTAAIAATSTSVVCTAMVIDAAANSPQGFALHGIRFNPVPGSQE